LRREELAALAGIGTSWYSRLEQGWDIQVSTHLLRRLAKALRLSLDETVYLFDLTGQPIPPEIVSAEGAVGPSLQRLLDSMEFTPAYIVNRYWDRIAWNRAALALFGDFSSAEPRHRNSLWRHFALPRVRTTNKNWESVAKAMLGEFYKTTSRYMDDPQVQGLIAELLEKSAEFRKWWPEREVHTMKTSSFQFKHPSVGLLELEYSTFYVSYHLGLRICILAPLPSHDTANKLRRMVRSTGTARPRRSRPSLPSKRRAVKEAA
jgi:transcriptional regulator with XRE-family HTH domain